ncbi:hypothetical protein SAMN05444374_103297 [Rhodococcoides kroppenstedtii]|uniref:Uncharacterized protein n=1 Tax=Rhodococcoides kroppenstedtii TaxID=293050 RepID=A0A1I0T1I7_9NOCA|nr:hypothetical protein [Rhodococcus kroppenstedtii]SFA45601.1 hypothetical protein SAMN05444374_103297 [Rhodococcus kroppenstedtii]
MTEAQVVLSVVAVFSVSMVAATGAGLPRFADRPAARVITWSGISGSLVGLCLYVGYVWGLLGETEPSSEERLPVLLAVVCTVGAVAVAVAIPVVLRPGRSCGTTRFEPRPNRDRFDRPEHDEHY